MKNKILAIFGIITIFLLTACDVNPSNDQDNDFYSTSLETVQETTIVATEPVATEVTTTNISNVAETTTKITTATTTVLIVTSPLVSITVPEIPAVVTTTTTKAAEPAVISTTSNVIQYTSRTVYIASSGKGKKYHNDPNCSSMKNPTPISLDSAKAMGYTPCKKCC